MIALRSSSALSCVLSSMTTLGFASIALGSDTKLASISLQGTASSSPANSSDASTSDDGRFIAFASNANDLVPSMPSSSATHVYVRDQSLQTTTRIGPAFSSAGNPSRFPVISADGSTVAFETANALVASDLNDTTDVYAYVVATGAIECVSVDQTGTPGGGRIYVEGQRASPGVISANGNFIAFQSTAQLAPGDTNFFSDVYVRDRSVAFTRLESVTALGTSGNEASTAPVLSADSQYVVFSTLATDLAGAPNAGIYRKERLSGAMLRVDVDAMATGFSGSIAKNYALSSDGRHLAMAVSGSNPQFGDFSSSQDIFVNDLDTQTISRVTFAADGGPANGHSRQPCISFDGRFVSFVSDGSNLVIGDTTTGALTGGDVVLRDRLTARNMLISVSDTLAQSAPALGAQFAFDHTMSSDGRYFAFSTYQRLDPAIDSVISSDAYSRDRLGFATFPAGKPGANGFIALSGSGSVSPSGSGAIVLNNAVPNATGLLFLSLDDHKIIPASGQLKNSMLITITPLFTVPFVTSSGGGFNLPYTLPNLPFVPAIYLQAFVQDFSVIGAVAVSQGLQMAF